EEQFEYVQRSRDGGHLTSHGLPITPFRAVPQRLFDTAACSTPLPVRHRSLFDTANGCRNTEHSLRGEPGPRPERAAKTRRCRPPWPATSVHARRPATVCDGPSYDGSSC